MSKAFLGYLQDQLSDISAKGLLKGERVIGTPQGSHIRDINGRELINFCANNYLGLANDPRVIAAAKESLERWGFGLSSVRFICGTQEIHKRLEQKLTEFLGTEDTILYSSCFDANGGLFEALLSEEDAILSDELNHASIIDGIRLCKAKRYRYAFRDMGKLEEALKDSSNCRFRMIATDGVFSMDGVIAPIKEICDLAEQYDVTVMVDDSHSVGVLGGHGCGTHDHCGCKGRVDILTGTLGKALGGASGGYVSGRKEVVDFLRQRSRPYLFSNTLAPSIVAASIAALDILMKSDELQQKLLRNTTLFRVCMKKNGFQISDENHPIVPIILGDARVATEMAKRLFEVGIYVVAFSYPVVPMGKARVRVQISAAHSEEDIHYAVDSFTKIYSQLSK